MRSVIVPESVTAGEAFDDDPLTNEEIEYLRAMDYRLRYANGAAKVLCFDCTLAFDNALARKASRVHKA